VATSMDLQTVPNIDARAKSSVVSALPAPIGAMNCLDLLSAKPSRKEMNPTDQLIFVEDLVQLRAILIRTCKVEDLQVNYDQNLLLGGRAWDATLEMHPGDPEIKFGESEPTELPDTWKPREIIKTATTLGAEERTEEIDAIRKLIRERGAETSVQAPKEVENPFPA
jgi:hypothetical protein